MKLTIEVKEEDIRTGKPGDGTCCMIAKALERMRPGCRPWVDPRAICIDVGSERMSASTPIAVAQAIKMFDQYGKVEPFSFDLDLEV